MVFTFWSDYLHKSSVVCNGQEGVSPSVENIAAIAVILAQVTENLYCPQAVYQVRRCILQRQVDSTLAISKGMILALRTVGQIQGNLNSASWSQSVRRS